MKDLILLHGALGSKGSMEQIEKMLNGQYNCHLIDLSGHGGTGFSPAGFGIEYFAEELATYIRSNGLDQPEIFGYSMGGYVALYLAEKEPKCLGKIITLGTKFAWSPETAAQETSRMNPELMEEKIPAYVEKLKAQHGEQWKELVWQTAGMMIDLGEESLINIETLKNIEHKVLVMRGALDQMVNDIESKWAVAHLSNGFFKQLEEQPHPIEKVDNLMLKDTILNFLNDQ